MDYREAGVDVEAGYEAVKLMKQHVQRTFDENVLGGLGSFGGFYALPTQNIEQPVLVAGTDGVGTKLKVAFAMDQHDTVGIDAVAMCVNDIVCQGAKPLFFLDYIATGKLVPQKIEQIVRGVSEGCLQAGCALIGGETAEMPGFYPEDEYDLAVFAVGLADRNQVINGSAVQSGDLLIGLTSSGLHSNGFSLVRKLLMQDAQALQQYSYDLGCTLGEELLRPTQIYVKPVLNAISRFPIHGIAHITGGGFIENIPRIIPEGLQAKIELGSWPMLPIFGILKLQGNLEIHSMYNTFNMGIGMVLAVPESNGQDALRFLNRECSQQAYVIGEVVSGGERITLCE